eukprot:m.694353 g.694353  ORF g.694353 m.694353 type:complete len:487 (-) comp22881_c0_seq1:3308-4768(-)
MPRPDYGVHFRTHFPTGTGTVILMEIPVNVESAAAEVVEMASHAFGHGARGVWLSTQSIGDVEDRKAATTEMTTTFAACTRGVFQKYPRRWIGVCARHLSATEQVKWMVKHFPACSGLWIEDLAIEIPKQRHIGSLDYARAKQVWQLVTTYRALGKWDGTLFATIHPKQLKTTFSLDKVIKASVTSKMEEEPHAPLSDSDRQKLSMQGLLRLADSATGVIDAVIIPAQENPDAVAEDKGTQQSAGKSAQQVTPTVELLAAMQGARPALTVSCPAEALVSRELFHVSELPNVAGHVDAILLTHEDGRLEVGQYLKRCLALSRWITPKADIMDVFSPESLEAGIRKEEMERAAASSDSTETTAAPSPPEADEHAPDPFIPDLGSEREAVPKAAVSSENASPLRKQLEGLLGRQLRVTLSDGRLIYGKLLCTDRDRNLVLGDSDEYNKCSGTEIGDGDAASSGYEFRRRIGLVMVPGAHIVSCATLAIS